VSIAAYENGSDVPRAERLEALATQLVFPTNFFELGDVEVPLKASGTFRALKSTTASERDAALAAGAMAVELSNWIGERFVLPPPDVPDCTGDNPETAAATVRAEWGLGERPIRNMIHLLEAHGVRVFSLTEDNLSVDAFSMWWRGKPYVFLNTRKSAERSRMDAAHELAHLVLDRAGITDSRGAEQAANRFASAFLMPRAGVSAASSGLHTVSSLVALKRGWNVSVIALAYRLHDLGLITDWHYHTLCVQMARLGYRTNEPNGIPRETSQLLDKVFETLRAEGISKAQVANALCWYPSDLNALVFGLVMLPISGGRSTAPTKHRSTRHGLKLLA